ncbi:MAG: aminotransferase class V-fold PLP-dependent enzyme [Bacteriovorax sp.]|nr:aminotransferase class V-fold PLP-dependent enzyme [Bacteriovorax sp.]
MLFLSQELQKIVTFNLNSARNDTSGCLHTIHFNNAGSSLPPNQVLEATINYLKTEARIGGYETALEFSAQHAKVYQSIALMINCKLSEVAIVESATRAWDLALSSITFQEGDRVLTSHSEYISNYLALLQLKKKLNFKIDFIPNDSDGQCSLEALADMVDEKVKLIAITHVPSTNGLVNPLVGISDIAKSVGALFLLDACQSIGQMPIDVEKIGCDFLAATGRKFLRAPRGSGFLYIRESVLKKYNLEPLFVDFSSATLNTSGSYTLIETAKRFENFEMSYASRIGLGTAVEYALNIGLENIWKRVQAVAQELRDELSEIPQVTLCDSGIIKSGIITFSIDKINPYQFSEQMRTKKINVSTGKVEFSIDLKERKIDSIVRASLHYYNSSEEIKKFTEELKVVCLQS